MRKIFTLLLTLLSLCGLSVQAQQTQTILVQGVPREVPVAHTLSSRATRAVTAAVPEKDKVRYFVGSGDSVSYVVIRWNDGVGMENMVWGYRWNAEDNPTGESMLRAIAKQDPRFSVLLNGATAYGAAIGGIGFDLNGTGAYAVVKSGNTVTPDSNGVVSVNGYGFDGYAAADDADHWRSGWYSGFWAYSIAASFGDTFKMSGVGATGRKLKNGSADLWSFSSFGRPSVAANTSYYFYTPAPCNGLYLPEHIVLPLANSLSIPAVIDASGAAVGTPSWTATDNAAFTSVTGTAAQPNGILALTGKTGESDVTFSATIDGQQYTSNVCRVSVVAPTVPLTAVNYAADTLIVGRNRTYTPTLKLTPGNATYTVLSYKSLNPDVVTVDSLTGTVATGSKEGEARVVATSLYDATVTDTLLLSVQPIYVNEIKMDSIVLTVGDILLPQPTVLPEDADNNKVTYSIANEDVASFYQKNIVAHKAGETTLTVTAADGHGAATTVKLIVKDVDHTPYGDYTDGTLILNEGWFGHDNGSMNYLLPGTKPEYLYRVYNRENPDNTPGVTGCYGMIYGGKLFVVSKQASKTDGTLVGGRLMVADAKTLKQLAAVENIGGGDGRSAVGVNPSKVYLGTSAGVVVFDAENMTVGKTIEGTSGRYQIGDMVKAGKYVFALQQNTGVLVIDAAADSLVKVLDNASVQGIAQTFDGNVWVASSNRLDKVNPTTLDIEQSVELPSAAKITCAWSAWVSTPFVASTRENVLFWNGGGSAWTAGTDYYRYEAGQPADSIKDLFNVSSLQGAEEGKKQTAYGTMRYDGRTNELYVPFTQSGWGTNYEHNWMNLFDAATGKMTASVSMKQNYWFPEMAIFPDKYAPEIKDVPSEVTLKEDLNIALAECVSDPDNMAVNISKTLTSVGNPAVATACIENDTLKVTPVAPGETEITLSVESNGVVTTQTLKVTVSELVGIRQQVKAEGILYAEGHLQLLGYAGWTFRVYTTDGVEVDRFTVSSDNETHSLSASGVLVVKGSSGGSTVTKKISVR